VFKWSYLSRFLAREFAPVYVLRVLGSKIIFLYFNTGHILRLVVILSITRYRDIDSSCAHFMISWPADIVQY